MDEKLLRLLKAHFHEYPRPWTEMTRFRRDLRADSLDLLEILCDIEREFRLFIPEEEMSLIQTVAEMEEMIVDWRKRGREDDIENVGDSGGIGQIGDEYPPKP